MLDGSQFCLNLHDSPKYVLKLGNSMIRAKKNLFHIIYLKIFEISKWNFELKNTNVIQQILVQYDFYWISTQVMQFSVSNF